MVTRLDPVPDLILEVQREVELSAFMIAKSWAAFLS